VTDDRSHLLFVATTAYLAGERYKRRPDLGVNDGRTAGWEVRQSHFERPHLAYVPESVMFTQAAKDGNPDEALAPHRSSTGKLPHSLRPLPQTVEHGLSLTPFRKPIGQVFTDI
jgi:hypothetical protein